MNPNTTHEDEILAELEERLDNPQRYWTPEGVPGHMDAERLNRLVDQEHHRIPILFGERQEETG
jgi:hypothetical protein